MLTWSSSIKSSCISERHSVTPPHTTMWPSPPFLRASTSSVVSPDAIVVFSHSAVCKVREKTTFRPAFRMPANGCSVAVVIADEIDSYAVRPMTCAYAPSRNPSCAESSGWLFSGRLKQKFQKSVSGSANSPSSE
jgi:hypothetical protein